MSTRKITALTLAACAVVGAHAALPAPNAEAISQRAATASPATPAAPAANLESGRYEGPQTITFTAGPGTEIRYTLDGTHPTRQSPLAEGPIAIEKTANVTAVAFTSRAASEPTIRGILIKTAEEPLTQFAVMSDIHLSTGEGPAMDKWEGYFDTLKRIAPSPDAIVSNGDQINDNHFNTASDHQYPRQMLEHNLARTGMTDTQVLMSFGNHDDYVQRMAEQYPDEWFPSDKGYYEAEIGGFPAFIVNTEAWNSTQASWLYGRLSELSADPSTQGQPIFVFGHRPIPSTVWDGAQASNSGLKTNLSDFPQVVYFSGHSHLNITDERSIHQQDFTSVNEGSMSYGEIDGKFQAFGAGLARDATVPTAQSVVVDVYADRIEIDRINYAADPGRTYTDEGTWSFQENSPFASSGSLAGPTWTIARGSTPAAVKEQFTYTQANRNTAAPAWGEQQPSVRQTENGPALRLPQAADDQYTSEYSLVVRDVESGATTTLVPANGRIYSDYVVAPKPAVLDIPLAVREGDRVGRPIDRMLEAGRKYEATLVAFDSYGNASDPRTFTFTAGELDRSAVTAAAEAAQPVLAQITRVLGDASDAEMSDFDVYLGDATAVAAMNEAATALTALIASEPETQDAVDAQGFDITDNTVALQEQFVPVTRDALRAAVSEADAVLAKSTSSAGDSLRQARDAAYNRQHTLNLSQAEIDEATATLRTALDAWSGDQNSNASAEGSGTASGTAQASGGTSADGSSANRPSDAALANTGSNAMTGVLAGAGALVAAAAAFLGLRLRRRSQS